MSYHFLSSQELISIRLKLKISLNTADHFFGLEEGSYQELEEGRRMITQKEDNLVRETICFNEWGNNFLPKWMHSP